MSEARRFLRYVLPGLALIIEVFFYLGLSNKPIAIKMWKLMTQSFGSSILVFLIAGGIGYLLSIIYHLLYWYLFPCIKIGVDHRKFICDSVSQKWLQLRRRDNNHPVHPRRLTKAEAWCVASGIWYGRRLSSKQIQGANERNDSLTDIFHGLGAALFASILAAIIWFSLPQEGQTPDVFWCTIFCIVSIISVHLAGYIQAAENTQHALEIILSDDLFSEYYTRKQGFIVYVDSSNLKYNRKKVGRTTRHNT